MSTSKDDLDQLPPAMPLHMLLLMLLAVTLGALAAAIVLPNWLPGLSQSLLGTEPKAYWYLSRASALVAYGLLWLSMALGLIITNKLARLWPGGPIAFDLHQFASLLGLAFALFHALILMGDKYIQYNLAQVLVPFNSAGYKPVWVGAGQIGLYLLAIVGLSFYIRKRLTQRRWRAIHYLRLLDVRAGAAARHFRRDGQRPAGTASVLRDYGSDIVIPLGLPHPRGEIRSPETDARCLEIC